jgi:L-fuconolactonase
MMQPIIDTHVHIWDLSLADYPWLNSDMPLLNRNYSLADLEEERGTTAVVAGVLVQASGNYEDTELMFAAAHQYEWIKGVVAWLPLLSPQAAHEQLQQRYLNERYFKGIRHQIHDEEDPRWLLQPAVIESLRLLATYDIPYDLVGTQTAHIETALQVAEQVPELRIVFDHLNQPPIATKEKFGKWGELMRAAASHPSFYAKISGLGTASGNTAAWTAEELEPYIAFVFEQFGIDRCFFGGDWPVSLLAGGYRRTWQAYETLVKKVLNDKEIEKVFYSNARNFYELEN